jgi:hypothetical protein
VPSCDLRGWARARRGHTFDNGVPRSRHGNTRRGGNSPAGATQNARVGAEGARERDVVSHPVLRGKTECIAYVCQDLFPHIC